jgi:hypothetical protein
LKTTTGYTSLIQKSEMLKNLKTSARIPWLTFVILATWEAEIRRKVAQDQPR